jgi:hypothetical protein
MTERTVTVKPLSAKAKNRFANIMGNNPICTVEQDAGEELFLVSENRRYSFWVSTRTGSNRFGSKIDGHWEIVH